MKIDCRHWSDCGVASGGCCSLKLFGGKPSFGICENICERRESAYEVFPIKVHKKGCKACKPMVFGVKATPVPPITGNPERPTVFLPFFGEFGHFIGWYIRMVHFHPAKHKIVYSLHGQEFLFPSAKEFRYDWNNPVPDRKRHVSTVIGADYKRQVDDELRRISLLHGDSTLVPCKTGQLWGKIVKKKFTVFARPLLPPVDVVIAPRKRDLDKKRNFEHWQWISKELSRLGFSIGVAGEEATSEAIPDLKTYGWRHPHGATAGAADLLSHCRIYLGTDNGISHLAALMDVPGIIIPNPDTGRTDQMRLASRAMLQVLPVSSRQTPQEAVNAVAEHLRPTGGGVIILSTGAKRRAMLVNSAASVRRHTRLGIQIVTDKALAGYDCRIVADKGNRGSRWHKTQLILNSPFNTGILLDDDAMVLRAVPPIEEVLVGFDIALAPDTYYPTMESTRNLHKRFGWSKKSEVDWHFATYPDCGPHPHFNSGVIFFRKTPAIEELCHVWHEEWLRFTDVDQFALYRALRRTGIEVAQLPRELHHRVGRKTDGPPIIVHLVQAKKQLKDWLHERQMPYVPPDESL